MNNYTIDRNKWHKLSVLDQMGNIYSEVGRTFTAKQRGDQPSAVAAAERAFDLFDATAEQLAAQHSPRLKEVLRVREIYAGEFLLENSTTLDEYFMQFAVAARLRHLA